MHAGLSAAINKRRKSEAIDFQITEDEKLAQAKDQQKKELLDELKNWEDVTESNAYFTKLKVTEILCCFLTIVHLGNSVVIYELDYKNYDVTTPLYISTISIFYLIVMLNVRYYIQFKWMVAKKFISCEAGELNSFLNTPIWKYMIIESIITQIGPQVFLQGYKIKEYNYVYDVTIEYELNNLLCCFVWIKCYAILRTILTTNKFTNPRAQRVCALNGCHANLGFSLKSLFKENSNQTLIITFFLSAFISAYMLRIFERPLSEVSEQDFNSFYTSFWNAIITMTTVGYGDVYPKSFMGRILGIILCIWGMILVSLFVVTVSEQLELTQLQKNSYVLIQRLVYRDALKKVSASALFSMFKFSKAIKNKKSGDKPKFLDSAEQNFKEKMLQFKSKSQEMRKFDNTLEYSYLSKNLIQFSEYIAKFSENQIKVEEQQGEILEYLGKLLTAKGVDFEEFMHKIEADEKEKERLEEEAKTDAGSNE